MRSTIPLLFVAALSLGACGGSDVPLTAQQANGVSLAAIGDQQVVFDQTLTISLQTTVSTEVAMDFSTDGTVGPDPNPYGVTGNPAVFDQSSGVFTWTPGADLAGKYSVQFTVTTRETPAHTASETIGITVWSVGAKLFTENCVSCHGVDGSGTQDSRNTSIQSAPASRISVAISTVNEMRRFIGVFSAAEIQALADHLATLGP